MQKLLLIIIVLVCHPSYAQLKGFSIGPYAEIAWPEGNLKQSNKNGLGNKGN